MRTIAVDPDDRTCVGYVLQGVPCVPVKRPMSSGRGTDAQSVPAKALLYRPHPSTTTRASRGVEGWFSGTVAFVILAALEL